MGTAMWVYLVLMVLALISSMGLGVINDRVSANWINICCVICALISTGLCVALYFVVLSYEEWVTIVHPEERMWLTIGLVLAIGFFVLGPFSLPSSVMSIRFGGKKICASISAMLDGFATVSSLLSGPMGLVSETAFGWPSVILFSTVVCFISFVFVVFFSFVDWRMNRRAEVIDDAAKELL